MKPSRHRSMIGWLVQAPARLGALIDLWREGAPHPTPRLPRVLQFPVNDICNARCSMCRIWGNKREREITPAELRVILANPLFRQLQAIGFNGGEPTLRADLAELVRAAAQAAPALRGINLITNGWKPETVCARIAEVAEVCAVHALHFDVMVSIDGVGPVHDRVRGRPGFFDAAVRVLDFACAHDGVHSVRVGATLCRDNAYDADALLDWCNARGVRARFRLAIPHQRLHNADHREDFVLDPDKTYHVAVFLDRLRLHDEAEPQRRAFYASLRDQMVYGTPRRSGCAWKSRGVTLLSNGDLAYCAVQSRRLGNAIDRDAETLYRDNLDHLGDIVTSQCADCRHDYDGAPPRSELPRLLVEKVLRTEAGARARPLVRHVRAMVTRQRERHRLAALRAMPVRAPAGGKAPSRILLAGWYGTETQGDKAILGGVVGRLRAAFPAARFDIASLEPFVTRHTAKQMPELGLERVHSMAEAFAAVAAGEIDLVVIAGGPLMAPVVEILDLAELVSAAAARGIASLVAGCGIGPLDGSARDKAIALLLDRASAVVLRDEASAALARRQLGVTRPLAVMLDPAFLWLADARRPRPREDVVVLALRDWPVQEYHPSGIERARVPTIKAAFETELIRCIDHLRVLSPATRIRPVCMHTLPVGGNDRRFYHRLFANHPALRAAIPQRHDPPDAVVDAFETARAALVMRFHGAVFAAATGTPMVAIDYSDGGKVAGLAASLGFDPPPASPQCFDGVAAAELLLAGGQRMHADLDGLLVQSRRTLDMALAALGATADHRGEAE